MDAFWNALVNGFWRAATAAALCFISLFGLFQHAETARTVKRDLGPAWIPATGAQSGIRESLVRMCQKSIAELAQAFDPGIEDSALFDPSVDRHEQARRLRLDLFAYREICAFSERALAAMAPEADTARAVAALKAFTQYFRDVSCQLLRYADFEPFERFGSIVQEVEPSCSGPARARFAEDCRTFGAVVEKTFGAVTRREEAKREPFDTVEGHSLAQRFLADAAAAVGPARVS